MEGCDYRWREGGRKAAELQLFSPLLFKWRYNSHTIKVTTLKSTTLWLVADSVSCVTITTVSFQNLFIDPKIHVYPLAVKLRFLKEKGKGSTRWK